MEKDEKNTAISGEAGLLEEIRERLALAEKKSDDYLDGWKRAKADLANYKKEEAVRLENFVKFGNESIVHDLVSVLDSFSLARMAAKSDEEAKGLDIILSQLEDILKKYGLEKMAVEIGGKFDPAREEAVGEMESDKPRDSIAEEVSRGYALNGRVIRPAKVRISKGQ